MDWNARLVTGDAVTEITRLKADDGGPMDIGGATLAAAAMRAGLIDEYAIVTHPVLVRPAVDLTSIGRCRRGTASRWPALLQRWGRD